MRIGIDFDGVLIDHKNIPTRKHWWKDKPKPNALEAVTMLNEKHDVHIFTAREENDWPAIMTWLYFHGFPILEITNVKRKGVEVFIDDRAIRFTNWIDIIKYF